MAGFRLVLGNKRENREFTVGKEQVLMFYNWRNIKISTYLLILLTVIAIASVVIEHKDLL
jgi:hypothetical protein